MRQIKGNLFLHVLYKINCFYELWSCFSNFHCESRSVDTHEDAADHPSEHYCRGENPRVRRLSSRVSLAWACHRTVAGYFFFWPYSLHYLGRLISKVSSNMQTWGPGSRGNLGTAFSFPHALGGMSAKEHCYILSRKVQPSKGVLQSFECGSFVLVKLYSRLHKLV